MPLTVKTVNDNKQHPLLKEYFFWQKKAGFPKKIPSNFFRKIGKNYTPERYLANFIWFFQFEMSFQEKERERVRETLRIVK